MNRPRLALALVRGLAPSGALACLALPFHALAGAHPSPGSLTGFEVLSSAPAGTPLPGAAAVAALTVGVGCLSLVRLRRPTILVVLVCLLATVAATALVVLHQDAVGAAWPGRALPGYWAAVSLLVAGVLAALAELLRTDPGAEFADEDRISD